MLLHCIISPIFSIYQPLGEIVDCRCPVTGATVIGLPPPLVVAMRIAKSDVAVGVSTAKLVEVSGHLKCSPEAMREAVSSEPLQ
ncbi:unnamed protein product, partial [Protopolystoma xenopodis]